MKKLFALMTALLLLTACQTAEEDDGPELPHSGEYLTDYIQTLSINGKEFPFPATFDEMKETFGDDMKSQYPNYFRAVLDRENGTYWVIGEFVFDGYYWGHINFLTENENGENAVQDWFNPDFRIPSFDDFEDDGIRGVTYWKDEGMVMEKFIYEEGRIPYSINGFTVGEATRAEVGEYFGEASYSDLDDGVTTDVYAFEDYTLAVYYGEYGETDLLTRFMIITNYENKQ